MYSKFNSRQKMLRDDFEVFSYFDSSPTNIGAHHHDFYEIYLYMGGSTDYIIGGLVYSLKQGDLLLIPPNVIHQPVQKKNEKTLPYRRIVLWISTKWWQNVCFSDKSLSMEELIKQNNGCFLVRNDNGTWQGFYQSLIRIIDENTNKKPFFNIYINSLIAELIVEISRKIIDQSGVINVNTQSDFLLSDILSYIHGHLNEKLTLDTVAKNFLVSKSKIAHFFTEQVGIPMYKYILQQRVVMAKNNITSGVPINKAWENCGFCDYTSFFRAFKSEYGISPKEYYSVFIPDRGVLNNHK